MTLYMLLWAPLLAAITIGLMTTSITIKNYHRLIAQAISTISIGTSFLCTLTLFIRLDHSQLPVHICLFDWLTVGHLKIPFQIVFDQFSLMILLVTTGVGSFVSLFAGTILKNQSRICWFFSYLSLVIFIMIIITISDSMIVMLIGWTGAGLMTLHRKGQKASHINKLYHSCLVQPLSDISLFLTNIIEQRFIWGIIKWVSQLGPMIGGVASFKMSGSLGRSLLMFVLATAYALFVLIEK